MLIFWFFSEEEKNEKGEIEKFTDYKTNENPIIGDIFTAECRKDGHRESLECFKVSEGYVWAKELTCIQNGAFPVHFVEVVRRDEKD